MINNISIIGSGEVGSRIGKGFIELGYHVIFYDIKSEVLERLKQQGYYIGGLDEAIHTTNISFICVSTPTINGRCYLGNVEDASRAIAEQLRDKNNYHLVVNKSTIPPGTSEKLTIPTLEKHSMKKVGESIGYCVNPEFLTTIEKTWTEDPSYKRDFFNEDRIIIGEYDKISGDLLEKLYKPLHIPIFRMSLTEAEFLKYAANLALMLRTTYWNQMFLAGKHIGLSEESIQKIADIVALDPRIGKYGSKLGKAVGGTCLPKDTEAFISYLKGNNFHPILLEAAKQINDIMGQWYGVRE